ncbi:PQQ-binding-like beta-propeller repeat protein [Streptomyces sp. NPDC127072]|uniref:outer membrane protein assembly factor BamB family protein n=1 Tax=Streptomyces sp. NPDC127072 TaxID=3347129 RepID=UPI00365D3EF7
MTQPPPPPPPNEPPQDQSSQDQPSQSQPPQSQPPQGGFGAPQDPPPGGFGAPQDPPPGGFGAPQSPPPGGFGAPTPPPPAQGPGYGYPQAAPPAAPPQQPYGYPQTPPPPAGGPGYGYPGPQQQPPYGYPQQAPYQAPYPTVVQGAGGGRKFNSSVVIIVAAVVAVALIVGGGVLYANSSGDDSRNNSSDTTGGGTGGKDDKDDKDDKGDDTPSGGGGKEKVPSDTSSKVLFQVPAPAVKDDLSVTTVGSWLTDKVYAKSGNAEIVGYDPESGAKLWTIPLPGPVCLASRHTNDADRTAIVYEPAMPTKDAPSHGCSEVAALDLGTGKKLWTKTVKSGDQKISLGNVTVSGNTVAVGSTSGGAGLDISTGKSLWAPKPTDTCYDSGYGGGDALVAVRKCGEYGSNRQLHIQTIDPRSGKVVSEYEMSSGIEYASVVSTNPLVVAADVGDSAGDGSGISDFFSIDNKTGKLLTKISAPGKKYAAKCDGITKIEACSQLVVGNNKLYIPTEEHDGGAEYSRTNEIVAFDLATGKQTGERADAGDGYNISPLRMDGGNVLAYKRPPYDKGGQVVTIDGTSFKETKLLENPATETVRDAETSMLPDYAEIMYSGGRLYMSQVYARKPSSADDTEYLAVVFGTN